MYSNIDSLEQLQNVSSDEEFFDAQGKKFRFDFRCIAAYIDRIFTISKNAIIIQRPMELMVLHNTY